MSVATIETARLAGERTRAEHLDVLAQLFADPAVAATLWPEHLSGPRTRQQTAALLEHDVQHWELHGFGAWIFVSKHTGEMVGRGGLERTNVGGRESVEVSYAVASALWGRGYATEMARAAADAAMRLGLPEIVGFTLTTNQASQCVLAKIGVRQSATCSTRDYRTGSADAPFPLRLSRRRRAPVAVPPRTSGRMAQPALRRETLPPAGSGAARFPRPGYMRNSKWSSTEKAGL